MKKIKSKFLTVSFLLLVFAATYVSCKKSEIPAESYKTNPKSLAPISVDPDPGDPLPQDPLINNLKSYMSSMVNVSVSDITYDPNSEQFSVDGVPQISLNDLSKSYEQNIVNGVE